MGKRNCYGLRRNALVIKRRDGAWKGNKKKGEQREMGSMRGKGERVSERARGWRGRERASDGAKGGGGGDMGRRGGGGGGDI
jgi:hypothetical protein